MTLCRKRFEFFAALTTNPVRLYCAEPDGLLIRRRASSSGPAGGERFGRPRLGNVRGEGALDGRKDP